MLTKINIQNFKSIRQLSFDAKRVNVLIGEPNTGKTNVLEALALLSGGRFDHEVFRELFRFRIVADLFFDQQIGNAIHVKADDRACSLQFQQGGFTFTYGSTPPQITEMNQQGNFTNWVNPPEGVRFYRFKGNTQLNYPEYGPLAAPFGRNLVTILYTNKSLRRRVSDLFRSRNFSLEIRPVEMELRITKSIEDELLSFPYESASETWRRIIFYMAVLETNQNSTILLDEPEANTFPFYTAYLAERIALDASNQFFLTTHNPYVLSSIVSKAPMKDVAVYVASMEGYCTTLKLVSADGLSRILDYGPDAFLNLDKLVES